MTRSSRFMARGDTTAATTARIPICHGARGDGASDHDDQEARLARKRGVSRKRRRSFTSKTQNPHACTLVSLNAPSAAAAANASSGSTSISNPPRAIAAAASRTRLGHSNAPRRPTHRSSVRLEPVREKRKTARTLTPLAFAFAFVLDRRPASTTNGLVRVVAAAVRPENVFVQRSLAVRHVPERGRARRRRVRAARRVRRGAIQDGAHAFRAQRRDVDGVNTGSYRSTSSASMRRCRASTRASASWNRDTAERVGEPSPRMTMREYRRILRTGCFARMLSPLVGRKVSRSGRRGVRHGGFGSPSPGFARV